MVEIPVTVDDFRKCARALFPRSPTPLLDAECLLAHVFSLSRSEILSRGNDALSAEQEAAFLRVAELRKNGLPVAYITGVKEFFGFEFLVTRDVLIPKPDTEILVEKTLAAIARGLPRAVARGVLEVCDVCTGSGCVALSLALCAKRLVRITATDISRGALETAKKNAERLLPCDKKNSVRFLQSDLICDTGNESRRVFDIIAANPPYVPHGEAAALLSDGRDEPLIALDGGADGLEITRRLAAQAAERLVLGGVFLTEIDERAAARVAGILDALGFTEISVHSDLAGKPRVVEASRPMG
jgi:release factor glutamine methyltransferase